MPFRAQHAITFCQARRRIGKVADAKHHSHRIKTLLGMRQAVCIPDAEIHAVRRRGCSQALPAYAQHGVAEIDPNQACSRGAALCQLRHDAAGATGHIQDRLGRMACHALRQTPAPDLVQTGTDHCVGQVVTRRDAAKHAA